MSMNREIKYLTSAEIDREKILLLIDASIQAYNAFDKDNPDNCNRENITPPTGYELIDFWIGIDAIFNHHKQVECYGIVFRSYQAPYTYIFAFRGTDCFEDLCDDFGCNHTSFKAYKKDVVVPPEVKVESGFGHIYTDIDHHIPSMQHQLFELIDRYLASTKPIDKLYVTGHSLGCTLCTMFALDLALSRPEIKVINYNFASPQVGNKAFVDFYQQQSAQQDPETRTIRVQNVYDKVTCTPLTIQGYEHLSYAYLIAFFRNNLTGNLNIVDNHSVENYKKVLECSFDSVEGLCDVTFKGYRNKNIKSVPPKSAAIVHFESLMCI